MGRSAGARPSALLVRVLLQGTVSASAGTQAVYVAQPLAFDSTFDNSRPQQFSVSRLAGMAPRQCLPTTTQQSSLRRKPCGHHTDTATKAATSPTRPSREYI